MQPTYITELTLTEFAEFREKQEPELTWFLPAISKLAVSLPLVTYHGKFISCLSTLVKPWNELNCYKKVKIRDAKSHLMQLIKSRHLCSFARAPDVLYLETSFLKLCLMKELWETPLPIVKEKVLSLYTGVLREKHSLSSDLSIIGIILIKPETCKLEFSSTMCWI